MAAVAQLNVRLEPELKAAGDAVLERMGVSSTQFIRAVWMKLSRGAEAFDQLIEVLAQEPAAAGLPETKTDEKQNSIYAFQERLDAFYREMGIDPATYVPPTEEEWEEYLLEEWHERDRERLIYHAE